MARLVAIDLQDSVPAYWAWPSSSGAAARRGGAQLHVDALRLRSRELMDSQESSQELSSA